MKDNGIKQRVAEVLRYKKINVNRASKILGIPQRTLNRQVNEDGNISMELLYAILDTYTDVSPLWLLLGEGDMVQGRTEKHIAPIAATQLSTNHKRMRNKSKCFCRKEKHFPCRLPH